MDLKVSCRRRKDKKRKGEEEKERRTAREAGLPIKT